jgi:hypothetical protein
MKMLVVSSCTDRKTVTSADALRADDFADAEVLHRRERQLAGHLRPAVEMYAGKQHRRMVRGVQMLREVLGHENVDIRIVSAGYGLLDEDRVIAPYDVTFATMTRSAAVRWARGRGIPDALREAIRGYELVFVLLGSRYLDAIAPPVAATAGQRVIFFASPAESSRLSAPGVAVVPAGRTQCSEFGAGTIALKGRMLELLGLAVRRGGPSVVRNIAADPTPASVLRALGDAVRP